MSESDEELLTCICNKTNKPKFEVQTHIFEEDLLPGCPVIEDLPPRHRRLFYPDNNREGSLTYRQFNDQQIKDARTFLSIGPNGTLMSKLEFQLIRWDSVECATSSIVSMLFDNSKGAKSKLSRKTVEDIMYFIRKRFRCRPGRVQNAITEGTALARKLSKPFLEKYFQSSV